MSPIRLFAAGRPGPIVELDGQPSPASAAGALLWADLDDLADETHAANALSQMALRQFSPTLLPCLRAGSVLGQGDATLTDPAVIQLRTGRRLRLVAAVDVLVEQSDGQPSLALRPVHILAGPGWLLTTRPTSPASPRLAADELVSHVESIGWPAGASASSQDLATLLLRGLVATFPQALTALTIQHHQAEEHYLASTQGLPSSRRNEAAQLEQAILIERSNALPLDRWISGLLRPGVAVTQAWFVPRTTVLDAGEIALLLKDSSEQLQSLLSAHRTSLQLIASVNAAEQLTLAEDARRRGQSLQTVVTWLTALFLVPTLVATVFSALPAIDQGDSTARAATLGAAMVISAGVAAIIVLARR